MYENYGYEYPFEKFKDVLEERIGKDAANQVKYIEAFEIAEVVEQMSNERKKELMEFAL